MRSGTNRLSSLSSVRALLQSLVQLVETVHGDEEDVGEVVSDGFVEVLELVGSSVDG